MRFLSRTALGIALLLPSLALAQSIGSTDAFTAEIAPQYPAPFSQATLNFSPGTVDLSNATISVSVAGKNIYKGGLQAVPITVGASGTVTTVKITVTSNGSTYSSTITIQPQDVALIVEPAASVPPLYPGKASVPQEGSSRIVAVANMKNAKGKSIDPATLSYAWTVDDTKILANSGIGKTALLVASPLQYRSRTVSVAITSQDGSLVGGADLSLAPLAPSIRLYVNDPLLGILFDHALTDTYAINGAEATLYAAPFSLPTTNGAPSIQWFLNGAGAQTGSSITLRPTGSGQGNASLSVTASGGDVAKAAASLSLSFGAKSSNLFGL